jgi:hypothetical protein
MISMPETVSIFLYYLLIKLIDEVDFSPLYRDLQKLSEDKKLKNKQGKAFAEMQQ